MVAEIFGDVERELRVGDGGAVAAALRVEGSTAGRQAAADSAAVGPRLVHWHLVHVAEQGRRSRVHGCRTG